MTNITMTLEDDLVKKVRRLAVERNTSMTALVRETLRQLAAREDFRTEERIAELEDAFNSASVKVGKRTWTRDELHER